MITVNNVTRKYGDFVAVDDVSFTINQGEIVGLLGHNGAGKTTIMKMLTGYLEPTAGLISIDGREISRDRRAIQQDIGYLPENCPVYPEMTVVDYLDYGAALHGVPLNKRAELVKNAIRRTALIEKGGQPISTLSRGYRQRTGVAQAILHSPKILILDEPTNGLDPTQIQQMRELIKELAAQSTVIISTHILQEVQAVCDRAIIVSKGKKVVDSRLDSLQHKSRLLLFVDGPDERVKSALMDVPGVGFVETAGPASQSGGIQLAVHIEESSDRQLAAAGVAKKIHDAGWNLYEMKYEARDLESIFMQISAQ